MLFYSGAPLISRIRRVHIRKRVQNCKKKITTKKLVKTHSIFEILHKYSNPQDMSDMLLSGLIVFVLVLVLLGLCLYAFALNAWIQYSRFEWQIKPNGDQEFNHEFVLINPTTRIRRWLQSN